VLFYSFKKKIVRKENKSICETVMSGQEKKIVSIRSVLWRDRFYELDVKSVFRDESYTVHHEQLLHTENIDLSTENVFDVNNNNNNHVFPKMKLPIEHFPCHEFVICERNHIRLSSPIPPSEFLSCFPFSQPIEKNSDCDRQEMDLDDDYNYCRDKNSNGSVPTTCLVAPPPWKTLTINNILDIPIHVLNASTTLKMSFSFAETCPSSLKAFMKRLYAYLCGLGHGVSKSTSACTSTSSATTVACRIQKLRMNIHGEKLGLFWLVGIASSLTSLVLKSCSGVSNIAPLRHLKRLKDLDLSYTKVFDITSLSELTQLRSIDLSCTLIGKIDSLVSSARTLQVLRMVNTFVKDLSPIEKFTSLVSLQITRQCINHSDLSCLGTLKKLLCLNIFVSSHSYKNGDGSWNCNCLENISVVGELTSLISLTIINQNKQYCDYSFLSTLVNLKMLKIDDDALYIFDRNNKSFLQDMQHLQTLDFSRVAWKNIWLNGLCKHIDFEWFAKLSSLKFVQVIPGEMLYHKQGVFSCMKQLARVNVDWERGEDEDRIKQCDEALFQRQPHTDYVHCTFNKMINAKSRMDKYNTMHSRNELALIPDYSVFFQTHKMSRQIKHYCRLQEEHDAVMYVAQVLLETCFSVQQKQNMHAITLENAHVVIVLYKIVACTLEVDMVQHREDAMHPFD